MGIVGWKKMYADVQFAMRNFILLISVPADDSFRRCTRFNVARVAYAKRYNHVK
jgi:hypothetical protein